MRGREGGGRERGGVEDPNNINTHLHVSISAICW